MQRYKANEIRRHKFIQVPKELFYNKRYKNISNDAKVLYGLLLDRLELSEKNNWVNENNEIYLIFTRSEVQKLINISGKTSTKIFKELKDVGLIYEERQGLKKPNLIYVGHIIYDSVETMEEALKSKNYVSRNVKNAVQETKILPLNNTNKNNTNISIKEDNELDEVILSESILKMYIECISNIASRIEYIELLNLQNKYSEELLREAIIIAVKNNKKNLAYIEAVLSDWWLGGVRNKNDIEAHLDKWKSKNRSLNRKDNKNCINPMSFNNFEAREYDYDELEKRLLGWDKEVPEGNYTSNNGKRINQVILSRERMEQIEEHERLLLEGSMKIASKS